MMLRIAICVCLAVCLTAAPASVNKPKQTAQSAVKKRSLETIQYQPNNNNPLSTGKKSMGTDGVAPPDVSQTAPDKLDKKAVIKTKTATKPATQKVSTEKGNHKTDDEIKELTQMVLNSKYSKENADNPPNRDTERQSAWQVSANAPQELPDRETLPKQDAEKKNVGSLHFHDYFYPLFANGRRRKRTAPVYTAEGMMSQTASGSLHRAKRDVRLTPKDMEMLVAYLENANVNAKDGIIDVPPSAFDYGRSHVRFGKRSGDFPTSEDSSLDDDRLQDEMDLVRYLNGVDNTSPPSDAFYESQLLPDSRESSPEVASSSSSSDEEFDFDGTRAEAIVYHGKPGIFIPTVTRTDEYKTPEKRQLMSFVSGSKRNTFYPYAYEPDTSSKWGALVPGEKRDVSYDDYERLYELANALRGRQEALSADRTGVYDDY